MVPCEEVLQIRVHISRAEIPHHALGVYSYPVLIVNVLLNFLHKGLRHFLQQSFDFRPSLVCLHRFNPAKKVGVYVITLRSEEHTSELQSLMRISYAVFCLKKKTSTTDNHIHNTCILNTITLK